jgi:hypothetical protein
MIPIMPQEKPLSLRPLKFKEAVSDLLKVKPPAKNISTHEEHEAQKRMQKRCATLLARCGNAPRR